MTLVKRTRLWVSAVIIALVILVAFVLSVPHTRDLKVEREVAEAVPVPVVTIHDVFKKGVHTISGSLQTPNACTPVNASATLAGDASSTQYILVALTFPVDSGICLQVPTKVPFQTTLTAPASALMEVTVNGAVASTTSS